jgi:ABC-2 type transport system ATP-binding protein
MNEKNIAIRTENLGKKFDTNWAVKDLNLRIYKGEIFAFLGPNAAGKTTTIKLLTGLLMPTTGRAFIYGYDIQKEPIEAKKFMGYIPDEPYLYEKLTGEEFVEFVAGIYEIEKNYWRKEMEKFFDIFGLNEYSNHLIADYSHGLRQKLIFTATFIHKPEVIIIDEPLVGIDPNSALKIKEILKEKAKNGVTIFLSTHTLSFAEEIATRIGIIDKGELITVGNLEELKTKTGIKGKLEEVFLKITFEEKL